MSIIILALKYVGMYACMHIMLLAGNIQVPVLVLELVMVEQTTSSRDLKVMP